MLGDRQHDIEGSKTHLESGKYLADFDSELDSHVYYSTAY
jgi:hypothetical protein